jgi:hypothetical protein
LWQTDFANTVAELKHPMSRLTIDVTDQQHQALKALAALEGKSIKQYALERLFPSDEQQAMQELKALLQSRLAAAELDEASPLSAVDIADDELRESGPA